MKKGLLAIAIALSTVAGYAQNTSLGINAGFGHTWIKNYQFGENEFKPAGNVGLSFVYSNKSRFGFGADAKYSIEGVESEINTGNTNITSDVRLNYIRVPLKALYFFGQPGSRLRPKVSVGPSFGFLVGGDVEQETKVNGNLVSNTSVKAKDLYEGFDFGIHASAGVHYRIVKNTWLIADVAYYNGLKDVSKGDVANIKNRNIGLNVGVNWALGTY